MKSLTCAIVRRRLQGAHDGELTVVQQIEVDAHLEWCDRCAAAMEDLQVVREAFRAVTGGGSSLTGDEHESFHSSVVSRVGAEQRMSLSARFRNVFREAHLVYAGMGAVGATVVCLMIMSSMMRFAALVSPGSNLNPVVVDARMLMPRVLNGGFDAAVGARSDDEEAFTLSAVVTREGRLVNLELHPEGGQAPAAGSSEARAVEHMLGAMAQARFEPARVAGFPVAVNMVWLVAHTTVHAARLPLIPLPAAPAAKKRRVDLPVAPPVRLVAVA